MKEQFIKFSKENNTGLIKLNRPKALNALDYDMATIFLKRLSNWSADDSIKRVLLKGEGNAFCAGGDVKRLLLSTNNNELKKKFFQKEYTLNNSINEFKKNYLSIWDGIVMGGGIGLSIYGNYRIATEKTKFAMPETAIGFFPDVGASYFLSKLKKGVGLFLGLTGYIINAKDLMQLGIATHFLPSKDIARVSKEFILTGSLNSSYQYQDMESQIKENENLIEDVFHDDLNYILKKLKNSKDKFAQKIFSHLLTRCPMSLAVTLELLNNAKSKTLSECLEIEYQLCQHMVYRKDFNNGVDAVLISKTNQPKWDPASLENINYDQVNKMFEPHVEKLYL